MPSDRRGLGVFFLLLGLSGSAGLMYEAVCTHYIKLFLGHAVYAQTLVLAIVMGGMALGAWLAGQYSRRLTNLMVGYATVEGVLGLAALLLHKAFVGATDAAFDHLIPGLGSAAVVKGGLAGLFILPQSILLGMTFPLMSGGILRRYPDAPGASIAILYFTNSFGAALGVLVSGFVLIGTVGLPGTIMASGILNILVAMVVWLLSKNYRGSANRLSAERAETRRDEHWLRIVLGTALLTGVASFMYEVAWSRMLSLVLGDSTHSFALILSAFFLGLALGGLYIKRRIDRLANPIQVFAYVQLAMGVLAVATLPLYNATFDWMEMVLQALAPTAQGYAVYHLASHVICLAMMFPASFCAGMTLPLLTYILMNRGHGERAIGRVYAANAGGATIGVIVVVHLAIPALGVKGAVVLGAAITLALGVGLLAFTTRPLRRFELPGAAMAAVLVVVLAIGYFDLDPYLMNGGVYREGRASLPKEMKFLFRGEGKTATVALVESATGGRFMTTNGKTGALLQRPMPSASEATMVLAGALALLHAPDAKTAAKIGFGSGLTTHVLLSTPQLERVDTVEIEPLIVDAARGFEHRVRNAYTDPRSRIHVEDARTFFAVRRSEYDIIVSEPSNPSVSGVASQFSSEFYALVVRYMRPKGVFVQWIQAHELDIGLVASIMKAMSPHFADFAVYTPSESDLLIIGRRDGPIGTPSDTGFASPGLAKELAHVNVSSLRDLEMRRLGGKKVLDPLFFSFGTPANSDYFPFLDQNAARTRFTKTGVSDLNALRTGVLPLIEMLEGRRVETGETQVTLDPFFDKAQIAASAVGVVKAFTEDGGWEGILEPTRNAATLVAFGLDRCKAGTVWRDWLAALVGLTIDVAPYVTPHEFSLLMDRIDGHVCAKRLPAEITAWFSLLRAIGDRNGAQMGPDAVALLLTGHPKTNATQHALLVRVAMLGFLTVGEPEKANSVWDRYADDILRNGQAPMDFRLLVAFAREQALAQTARLAHAQPVHPDSGSPPRL